jgi:hypothetical protein
MLEDLFLPTLAAAVQEQLESLFPWHPDDLADDPTIPYQWQDTSEVTAQDVNLLTHQEKDELQAIAEVIGTLLDGREQIVKGARSRTRKGIEHGE